MEKAQGSGVRHENGNQMVFEVLGRQTIEIYALRAEVLRLRRELAVQAVLATKKESTQNEPEWGDKEAMKQ